MIQGLFRWLSIATLFLFLGNSLNAQVYSLDTVHLSDRDRIPIPEVSGEAYYLHAKPLRSPKTPGNKTRAGDWVNLNYSASNNFLVLRGPARHLRFLWKMYFCIMDVSPQNNTISFITKVMESLCQKKNTARLIFQQYLRSER